MTSAAGNADRIHEIRRSSVCRLAFARSNLDPTFFSFIAVKSASYRCVQGTSADSSLMVTAKTSSPLWERIEVRVILPTLPSP
jgi:hypothetical protein